MAHSLMECIEAANVSSPLPPLPDKENIEKVLVQMPGDLYV
jgi:hypothetical protein